MSALYFELRPAFTGDAAYTATLTLPGSGSIAGWTFTATLTDPYGTVIAGGATAVVANAVGRTVTLTAVGQTVAGSYGFSVRRVDDLSNAVVALGIIEITDPAS